MKGKNNFAVSDQTCSQSHRSTSYYCGEIIKDHCLCFCSLTWFVAFIYISINAVSWSCDQFHGKNFALFIFEQVKLVQRSYYLINYVADTSVDPRRFSDD